MSIVKIRSALVAAYQAIPGLNLPFAQENRAFTQPADGSAWAAIYFMPGNNTPVTLGNVGQDEMVGLFQIDFYAPAGKGTNQLLTYADSVRNYFKAGMRLMYDSQEVLIKQTSFTRIRRSDTGGEFVLTGTVSWQARFNR